MLLPEFPALRDTFLRYRAKAAFVPQPFRFDFCEVTG